MGTGGERLMVLRRKITFCEVGPHQRVISSLAVPAVSLLYLHGSWHPLHRTVMEYSKVPLPQKTPGEALGLYRKNPADSWSLS